MQAIKGAVIAALLTVWCFPAVSLAKPEPATPPALPAVVTSTSAGIAQRAPTATGEQQPGTSATTQLAQRERQARDLQDYRGGEGVYVYFGSGVLVVLVVVLLILLI